MPTTYSLTARALARMRTASAAIAAAMTATALVAIPATAQDATGAQGGDATGQTAQSADAGATTSGSGAGDAMQADESGASGSGDTMQAQGDPAAGGGDGAGAGAGMQAEADSEAPVAKVGDTTITAGQVMEMISGLPPQVRQQPPAILVPAAVEQLVLRELVLQEAQASDLAESDEVRQMAEGQPGVSEEDALVQAYLQQEIGGEPSDADVQEKYESLQSESEQELPPLEEVRPQVVARLQNDKLQSLREELASDTEVVYYGPEGDPVSEGSGSGAAGGTETN